MPGGDIGSRGWRRTTAWLASYRVGSDLFAKGVMLAVTVAAARRLSLEQFGAFGLASTVGWLTAVVADAGLQMHVARSVARAPEQADYSLGRWLPVRLASLVVTVAAGVVTLRLAAPAGMSLTALVAIAAAYAVNGLTEFLSHVLRGLQRTDVESAIALAQRTLLAVLAAIALWRWPGLSGLGLALLVSGLAGCLATFLIVRRLTARAPRTASTGGRWREFVHASLPIGAATLLSALYFRIDVLLLEHWRGVGDVGLYNAMFRVIDARRLLPAAWLAVTLPALCRADDLRVMTRLASSLAMAAVAATLVAWVASPALVPAVFGAAYADGVAPLRVLLLAYPLMTLNYVLSSQLIAWNRHGAWLRCCGGALVVNVLVNAKLIPSLGMTGAAWATVWTEVFISAGCALALLRAPSLKFMDDAAVEVP